MNLYAARRVTRRAIIGLLTIVTFSAVLAPAPASARPAVPGAPRIINQENNVVDLEWNAVASAVGYRLYALDDRTQYQPLASGLTSTTNSVTLTLTPGEHQIFVKAVGADGSESWRSGTRVVRVAGTLPERVCDTATEPGVAGFNGGNGFIALTNGGDVDDLGLVTAHVYRAVDTSLIAEGRADDPIQIKPSYFAGPGTHVIWSVYRTANGTAACWSGMQNVEIDDVARRPNPPRKPVQLSSDPGVARISFGGDPDSDNSGGFVLYNADTTAVLYDGIASWANLTDLAPGQYRVYAKARNANGVLSWRSGIATIVVSEPGQANPITMLRLTRTEAYIGWSGPNGYSKITNCDNGAFIKSTNGDKVYLRDLAVGDHTVCVMTYDSDRRLVWSSSPLTFTITG